MPLTWDNQSQAFVDAEAPMTYNHQLEAWEDSTGYEYNRSLEAWEKVWPGQQYIYKDGRFVQGTYRWFKFSTANQSPTVTVVNANGYLRLNVTGTQTWGTVPVIVFSAPIPATARTITLKFKWGSSGRPYGFSLRAMNSYAENNINNCVVIISLTNANNTIGKGLQGAGGGGRPCAAHDL